MTSSTSFKNNLQESDALRVLNAVSGFGNRRISKLIQYFGSAVSILNLPSEELAAVSGIPHPAVLNLRHFPVDDFLARDDKAMDVFGARLVTVLDDEYPEHLRSISDAPVVLYVSGDLPGPTDAGVAIVGARRASLYGIDIAERFAVTLAENGVIVISGLARGIDAAAHRGALKANGRTVAVLGCGLDVIYPTENEEIYRRIRERGCLISEFPFGTPPVAFNFPRRNRIVSGLSLGVIVVEANIKSGALITAAFAAEQGREVFAIPGRVDAKLSAGPHALIRQGAKLTLSVEDVLEELPVHRVGPLAKNGTPDGDGQADDLDEEEQMVLGLLKDGPQTIEDLEVKTGRSPALLMGPLLSLQIRRVIRELPGKVYEIVDRN
jgi:DNA processing protein